MDTKYLIMPFSTRTIENDLKVLVSTCGDYIFLSNNDYDKFINHRLKPTSSVFMDLESNGFLSCSEHDLAINLSAVKYRTRKGFLNNFTTLHMMVTTVRCNQKCEYCQVSCEGEEANQFDMSIDAAHKIVDFIFCSPSNDIKIEFQGGEPLLNWETVISTIEYAKNKNIQYHKNLTFVVCTNLTLMNPEKLLYLEKQEVAISTSLDGPLEIHDFGRKLRTASSSHEMFSNKLSLAQKYTIPISALMTTTKESLGHFPAIVDEYLDKGFEGIFFRPLNPYGFAHEKILELGYTPQKFIDSYKEGLEYIIKKNKEGSFFIEYYAQLLLTRILTSYPTGFVDLQSPAGTGICGVIYDFNGDIYPSDEARMLSRMGDCNFRLGNVYYDNYTHVFGGEKLRSIIKKSCIETTPRCGWCAYQIYCGVDPVRNYLETGDVVGYRPKSFFCELHSGLFDLFFKKIYEDEEETLNIFWNWIMPQKAATDA